MSDSSDGAPLPGGAPDPHAPTPSDSRVDTPASAGELPESAPADTTTGLDPYAVADDTADDPYRGAVPPGYDWPTHGGYLGCVMGVVVGLVVGGFLGSLLIGLLSVSPLAGIVSAAAGRLTVLALTFFATLFLTGRAGYQLGRRFYREYPTPERDRVNE